MKPYIYAVDPVSCSSESAESASRQLARRNTIIIIIHYDNVYEKRTSTHDLIII